MILRKNRFFLLLMFVMVLPFLLYNLIWLWGSEKVTGIVLPIKKEGKSASKPPYESVDAEVLIVFPLKKEYITVFSSDISLRERDSMQIRYRRSNPYDARVNNIRGIWRSTSLYAGLPLLMLLFLWVYPGIIPPEALIRLRAKKPFVSMYTPVDSI